MHATQARAPVTGTAKATRHNVATGAAEDVAVLTLDERGVILDCSHAAETLFKYRRSDLVWQHVSMLLPQLAKIDLMRNGEPNPGLRYLCRIGRVFQTMTKDGESFPSELFLTVLFDDGHGRLLLIVRPAADSLGDNGQQHFL
jgi:PAS domain S-box-containing protein